MGRKLKTALTLLHPDMKAKVLLKQLKQKIVHDGGARTTPPQDPETTSTHGISVRGQPGCPQE